MRFVLMTARLADALRQARSVKGRRVVCDKKGTPLTQKEVQIIMRRVGRRANVNPGVHILRHHADGRIMPTAFGHELTSVEIERFQTGPSA